MAERSRLIVFRTDASSLIGMGHVMRCLALAETLTRRGAEVHFVCRGLAGGPRALLEGQYPYPVHHLPAGVPTPTLSGYAAWLGVDWSQDAAETRAVLEGLNRTIDWLVVDHYGLDARWEAALRPQVGALMAIDDLFERPHACDLLLNQNLLPNAEAQYAPLVPESCRLLLGPAYALLRGGFDATRRAGIRVRERLENLLLFFGGADPTDQTSKALRALQQIGPERFKRIDVLIGGANPNRERVLQLCATSPVFHPHDHLSELAAMYRETDLVLGAGGASTWERACLGLPGLVVTIADNQLALTRAAEDAGLVRYLGLADEVDEARFVSELTTLLEDPRPLRRMSEAGPRQVDGLGTERIAQAMGMDHYRLAILSDAYSWLNEAIAAFLPELEAAGHVVRWVHTPDELPEGDFAFFLSCGQLVRPAQLARNRHNLVIHESALPAGKGWSPLTWQILEGRSRIPITLFEAAESVDSGAIYLQDTMAFQGTELVDDLRVVQAAATLKLCRAFLAGYPDVVAAARAQEGESTYYPRRGPKDSRLDLDRTLREQFNLLRVVDNDRYPAYFEHAGVTYRLRIERVDAPTQNRTQP